MLVSGLLPSAHVPIDSRADRAMLTAALLATTTGVRWIESLISFVIWLLILIWIYNIAKRKGRHAIGWLILGFFFSLIALIIVALLPSKVTTRAYEDR
jgi:uncharacterized BrkB/YihY/UPF0761 family membrane protein